MLTLYMDANNKKHIYKEVTKSVFIYPQVSVIIYFAKFIFYYTYIYYVIIYYIILYLYILCDYIFYILCDYIFCKI